MLEKDIQNLILQWLNLSGPSVMAWRQNAGMIFTQDGEGKTKGIKLGMVGISDIIGIWHGKPLAIEVKQPRKNPTAYQLKFLNDFTIAGGIGLVAHSLEEVQEELNKLKI